MKLNETEIKMIGEWLANGETGLSSLSMCSVLMGAEPKRLHYPLDPSDFDRCIKFLRLLNPAQEMALMVKLAKMDKHWNVILNNLPELKKLYYEECVGNYWNAPKLYKLMQQIGL